MYQKEREKIEEFLNQWRSKLTPKSRDCLRDCLDGIKKSLEDAASKQSIGDIRYYFSEKIKKLLTNAEEHKAAAEVYTCLKQIPDFYESESQKKLFDFILETDKVFFLEQACIWNGKVVTKQRNQTEENQPEDDLIPNDEGVRQLTGYPCNEFFF